MLAVCPKSQEPLPQKVSWGRDSGVEGECRGGSEETTQYKCNCFSPPLPSVPFPQRWPSLHTEFIWTYRATGSINSLHSPRGSTQFIWKRSRGSTDAGWTEICGKRGNRRGWTMEKKLHEKWESALKGGELRKKTRELKWSARTKRDQRRNFYLPHTPRCRRCHPGRCPSTRPRPPRPGRSPWKVPSSTGWH